MAELELIVERLVSGKGVVKLPKQDEAAKIRYLILYADVARDPINRYLNYNYNPPKGRYATMTFLRNGYVIDERTLDYEKQSWDGVQDIAGQALIAVKCAYSGILQTFINLGLALALPPISVTDTIKDYESLYLSWDEIRVKCYADTAVRFRLYTKDYDTCEPDKDKQDRPLPPPPPPPKVPAGTPLEVDPPYDEDTSDDGNTDPFEDDTIPEPPPEYPECTVLAVVLKSIGDQLGEYIQTYRLYAPFEGARPSPTEQGAIEAFCAGAKPGLCVPPAAWRKVDKAVGNILSVEVISVTPEPPTP